MDHIGIDVHKRESQIYVLCETGEVTECRVATARERFAAVLGNRGPAKILVEASTESEWVALCLEGLGHEVVVADPNYAPMYGQRTRAIKTDRRDAAALAEACRIGAYRAVHRVSAAQRRVRQQLRVREAFLGRVSKIWLSKICLVPQSKLSRPLGLNDRIRQIQSRAKEDNWFRLMSVHRTFGAATLLLA